MSQNVLASVLERTGALIDISSADQERAIARYDHLGQWLAERDPGRADVHIYPQGSFRLGTVVRPSELGGDFDIDLVFLRDLARTSVSQDELRQTCGELLAQYCLEQDLESPVELGRCWRLELFDDGFHLDVLPVIPDEHIDDGILLSDRDLRHWLPSNPIGYADWFYERMNRTLFDARRATLAKELGRTVDDVPGFFVRTPLQRVVQLLKHSRDVYFSTHSEHAPASILITTLAAMAYAGQVDVERAVAEVVATMANHVESRDGRWWVENPAHPGENFADKWNTNAGRREAFYAWVGDVSASVDTASRYGAVERVGDALKATFGAVTEDAVEALKGVGAGTARRAASGEVRSERRVHRGALPIGDHRRRRPQF